jgi:hypothetical protein
MIRAAGLILHRLDAVIVARRYQKDLWRSSPLSGSSPFTPRQKEKRRCDPRGEAAAGIFAETAAQQSSFVQEFDAQIQTCLQPELQE